MLFRSMRFVLLLTVPCALGNVELSLLQTNARLLMRAVSETADTRHFVGDAGGWQHDSPTVRVGVSAPALADYKQSQRLRIPALTEQQTHSSPAPVCEDAIDIILAVDQSGSIGGSHFDMLRTGLIETVDDFSFNGTTAAKLGVVKFSTGAVRLFEGLSSSKSDILKHIKSMSYDGGFTHTHSGLEMAKRELEDHGRMGVTKVIVVFTDGECRLEEEGQLKSCDDKVRQVAAHIKVNGIVIGGLRHPVTIIAVGFGKTVGSPELTRELRFMASQKDEIQLAKHYEDFKLLAPQVGKLACEEVITTPSVSSGCTMGSCVIWGDPHVVTFQMFNESMAQRPRQQLSLSRRNDVSDEGTHWLVHTGNIHIQTGLVKSKAGHTSVKSLTVGGPFLNGSHLVIRGIGEQTTWDGDEITPMLGTEFVNDLVHIFWNPKSKNVQDDSRDSAMEVSLPGGVLLTVNRWRSMMAVEVNMCVSGGSQSKQSGLCGSFAPWNQSNNESS